MKFFIGSVLFLILVSCNEQRSQPSNRITVISKDSDLVKSDSINPYAPVDISPMDMSYFPVDYPVQKMSGAVSGLPIARIIYSRPHRQGRKVFGQLLKYGEPWRLGANEATEIEFFRSVTIQNKKVAAGKYILYAIPYQDKWTILFNTNLNTWGLKPNPKDDIFRFEVPVQTLDRSIEYFSMVFNKKADGADLVMAWDEVEVHLRIQF